MKINGFIKTYDGHVGVETPPLELAPGRICAVIGANGSGKSTFAKVLAGVIPADGGQKLFPEPVSVGYMPQKSYAFRMSTKANVLLSGGSAERAEKLMRAFQLEHLASRRAKRLSGGEIARMALARVLLRTRELLILDEPTASMDIESTALTEALVTDFCRANGSAVIWVTHSLHQARRIADTAIFMYRGRLLESGDAEKILYSPQCRETKQFLEFYGAL